MCMRRSHFFKDAFTKCVHITGKKNRFPLLDMLGYLKNTYTNPKFGKVRQVPTREFPTKSPVWDSYGYS